MPSFSTEECAWAQTTVSVLGAKMVGIVGWEFTEEIDAEHLYAAGADPIDIQTGNIKVSGSIKLLKFELDKLNDAAQAAGYADIKRVPKDAIVVTTTFKKTAASKMRTITSQGLQITSTSYAMEQNAKSMPITLPFLAMKMITA